MKTPLWQQYEEEEYETLERAPQRTAPRKTPPAFADEAPAPDDKFSPLAGFFADELIVGEPNVVKSGKEASVYCCQAHPRTGKSLLAAKVYRPRQQRSFKNDGIYQQGRTTMDARADRAILNGTNKGRAMQFQQWISCEFETLRRLHAAGADVPKPYGKSDSALLIDYFGERGNAAPQLINVKLTSAQQTATLFEQLLHNLDLFLECDRVHGDLSPYNILLWGGKLQIIDFPQAVDPMDNPHAFTLFTRDMRNVCEHFALFGVRADPDRLALRLWLESGRAHPQRVNR